MKTAAAAKAASPATGKRRLRRGKPKRVSLVTTVYDRLAHDVPRGVQSIEVLVDDPDPPPQWSADATQRRGVRRNRTAATTDAPEWFVPTRAKHRMTRSVRTDPLGWMHAHRRLADVEYMAGLRWQELYSQAQLGNVQAMDTSKEPVDGGGLADLLTDVQRHAIMALRSADLALIGSVPGDRARGMARVYIVRDVLAESKFVREVAADRGLTGRAQENMVANELRIALGVLAVEFGLANALRGR